MAMRHRGSTLIALLFVVMSGASCRQALGIDEATLACPPDLPDCVPCEVVSDCGAATECHAWTCKDSVCMPLNAPPRTECTTGVCSDDPVSECAACLADADCPNGGVCNEKRMCVTP